MYRSVGHGLETLSPTTQPLAPESDNAPRFLDRKYLLCTRRVCWVTVLHCRWSEDDGAWPLLAEDNAGVGWPVVPLTCGFSPW